MAREGDTFPGDTFRHDTFRADINGLRGLCVALVVAFHLQLRGSGGGFIGVDVFFVISGYLMTRIVQGRLEAGGFGYLAFLRERAARIWPALGAMVAALLVIGTVLLPPFDLRILAEQAWRAILFSSNHFFLERSGYDTQSADTNWLLHTWSLSVEWQFYLLYPLLLLALARLGLGRRGMAAVLGAAASLSLACQWAWAQGHPDSAFFLLPARAWEMFAGGVVYLLAPREGQPGAAWRGLVGHAGTGLVLVSALWLGVRHVPPVGQSLALLAPVGGAALLLWAGAPRNLLLDLAPLQALGRWSYSIYLWHWPLIVGLRLADVWPERPLWTALAVGVGSVVLGALSYRWFERRPRPRWGGWRRPVLVMGVAGLASLACALTDGFSSRYRGPDFYTGYAASIAADYYPDRCSNFMKTAQATQVCSIDKPGSRRRLLVIGDSHAEQLWAWFRLHSAVSVDFYTQAECVPVPGFERQQPGFHCLDYADAAWRRAASAEYDTVVVAALWAGVGLDGAPFCHREGAGCVPVSGAHKQALARDEVQAAVRRLLAAGKTVVMLSPTPVARVRVPERITREQFWYGKAVLSIDEQGWRDTTAWMAPLFDSLKGAQGFHLVSLDDRLCADGRCKVYDEALERPVYLDESHFDPVWMAANGDVFAPFVRP